MVGSRKEAVRVFVDTNVDASILLIENLSTTIGDVKSALHGCIKYIKINGWDGCGKLGVLVALPEFSLPLILYIHLCRACG